MCRTPNNPKGRLLTCLCLNVKNAASSCLRYISYGLFASSVQVTGEFGMFYKTAVLQDIFECTGGDEVIFFAITLTSSGLSRGV